MYINNDYRVKIGIKLNNGIYTFDGLSSTGKTRLCNELKKLKAYGERVGSYTYNDYLSGKQIEEEFKPENEVVMLDRYDMYSEVGWDLIKKYSKSCVVLIDTKEGFKGSNDDKVCFIDMKENSIEVSE